MKIIKNSSGDITGAEWDKAFQSMFTITTRSGMPSRFQSINNICFGSTKQGLDGKSYMDVYSHIREINHILDVCSWTYDTFLILGEEQCD